MEDFQIHLQRLEMLHFLNKKDEIVYQLNFLFQTNDMLELIMCLDKNLEHLIVMMMSTLPIL